MIRLTGFLASHVGNIRDANQDSGIAGDHIFVVADGMGGHQGGEVASGLAVSKFEGIEDLLTPEQLIELSVQANLLIFEKSSEENLQGMGTTLVALSLHEDGSVSAINVGDSRIYWLRDGNLAQVTKDHSFVNDLVEQKEITPEEALTHPKRNVITRALGISPVVEVDRFPLNVKPNDRFLLCSDGLTDEVDDEEITRILVHNESPQDAAEALIQAALGNEGRDNITALVVDTFPQEKASEETTEETEDTDPSSKSFLVMESNQTEPGQENVNPKISSWKRNTLLASLALAAVCLIGYFVLQKYSEDSPPLQGDGSKTSPESSLTINTQEINS